MSQRLYLSDVVRYFRSGFRQQGDTSTGDARWVGLENEYPLVSVDGSIMKPGVLQTLWYELQRDGWELVQDDVTQAIVAAKRPRQALEARKVYAYDLITCDMGYATLEVDLAPAPTLHEAAAHLHQILQCVAAILARHDTLILGYGVQPNAVPSLTYVSPKGRYKLMLDVCRAEHVLDTISFQTINAACQTQVEVTDEEAIDVLNVLNATSGLRIALFANSPIWQNTFSPYKAVRQWFVEACWGNRLPQLGIPPLFHSFEHYANYLLDFRALMVQRGHTFYRLDTTMPFRQFFFAQERQYGISIEGVEQELSPEIADMRTQCGFAWFCTRLQPAYGTVEDRVSCQQPPIAHLCSSALTLGLVENHSELRVFAKCLSLEQWRDVRQLALTHGLSWSYVGLDAVDLAGQLVAIAAKGLRIRGLGEEQYLEPLYDRLAHRYCPADLVRQQFHVNGIAGILMQNDMRRFYELPTSCTGH